ncbi:hypothetical protein NDU88_002248 [Pleurodeles waltl]|uniref:Endonuclease/exonuclease/phosphatase family domain-containing protein 1 n=1 Tax=Pleurodeles waltl TaxID=8319 RepID=A0AAV7L0R1_PLEWA|nr:hypothetical protein NDU88_002248 [Pleurodeles waltl]
MRYPAVKQLQGKGSQSWDTPSLGAETTDAVSHCFCPCLPATGTGHPGFTYTGSETFVRPRWISPGSEEGLGLRQVALEEATGTRAMGQSLRCHRGSHNGMPRSLKKKKRPLSAASQPSETLLGTSNQVNINLASEEELMTLPGVSRAMAHSITVYRHRIGGFRKVEDLVLVAGFGAEKMQQLRSEICVGAITRRPMQGSCLDLPSSTKVNLNTASMAELLNLGYLSEELVQAILSYRTGHGAFRRLKDLENVNGVDEALLKQIEPHLSISIPRPATIHVDLNWADFSELRSSDPKEQLTTPNGPRIRDPHISQPSQVFSGLYAERRVVRVGSCILQGLTLAMVEDRRLREGLCLSLLENGITLLAVQEVLEEAALEKLCREMETPSLPAVRDWPGPRGSWRYVIPDCENETQEEKRAAFLWDSTSGLELVSVVNIEIAEPGGVRCPQECQPLLGHFKVEKLDFKLFNVHVKYLGQVPEASSHVANRLESLRSHLEDGPQLLALGVFRNELDVKSLSFLEGCGFSCCIPSNTISKDTEDPLSQRNGPTEVTSTEKGRSFGTNSPSGEPTTQGEIVGQKVSPNHVSSRGTQDPPLNSMWSSSTIQALTTGRWGVIQNGLEIPQPRCEQLHYPDISHSRFLWVELYKG